MVLCGRQTGAQRVGTITGLETQKRSSKRVNVYIDGEFRLSMSLSDAALLRRGQVLSEADIAELQARDAAQRATDVAARMLGLRPRSTFEVRQALRKKEIAPPVIDAAIERLMQMGYLDDRAFAEFWVKERNASKPVSTRALQFELRQKGIPRAIIDEVLEEQDEVTTALDAAWSHARRLKGKTVQEARQNLMAFLARRGYSSATARSATQQVIAELENAENSILRRDLGEDDTWKEEH